MIKHSVETQVQDRELPDKRANQANSQKKGQMTVPANGHGFARHKSRQETKNDGHQQVILKVKYDVLSHVPRLPDEAPE